MTYQNKISFSAEDYGAEYMRIKRDLPGQAERILDDLAREYDSEYKSGVRSHKPQNFKEWKAQHDMLGASIDMLGLLGGGAGFAGGLIIASTAAATLAVAGGAALAAAGFLAVGTLFWKATERPYGESDLARDLLQKDVESGKLIKRYMEVMKRHGKEVYGALEVFNTGAMSVYYKPIVEAKPLPTPPVAFLTGSFNGETAETETKPAALPPPSTKKDPKP